MISNVSAELLLSDRYILDERAFVELVVWSVPEALPGCVHRLKYRLAYVVEGSCVIRYDNESGKGDHRHVGSREQPYVFKSLDALQVDFWSDVAAWEVRK